MFIVNVLSKSPFHHDQPVYETSWKGHEGLQELKGMDISLRKCLYTKNREESSGSLERYRHLLLI